MPLLSLPLNWFSFTDYKLFLGGAIIPVQCIEESLEEL